MFLGLLDPDPFSRGCIRIRLRILLSSCKNSKKNLDTYYFVASSIHDVYPGSRIRLCSIPDPTLFHPGSRIRTVSIPDLRSSIKNLCILTPQKVKKWFLSSKKYDPGFSSRIPDPGDDFLPSRIQGSKRYPIPNPDPQHCILYLKNNENEPSQSHRHKKLSKIYFLSGILKVND